MLPTSGYAVKDASSPFELFKFNRREVGASDVLIKILYCGICHSDIHQVRNEWGGGSIYPMVPGHEIVGQVVSVGANVKNYKPNDLVGVGCFVDSCRKCSTCNEREEQFCEHIAFTYNGLETDSKTPTYGGYSSQIVVDERYVLRVSDKLPLANVAPLLCAGITMYSPLKRFKAGPGKRVAIAGLGGLGHMGVKLAVAMGAEVTVLSTSAAKEQDARRLGAHHFIVTRDAKNLAASAEQFDLIIDAISAEHDINLYLNLLRKEGVLVLVGIAEKPLKLQPPSLIRRRRMITGSMIGGTRETQEMLDFCAEKNISADVEIVPIQELAPAYERTIKGDVRYRFVIDLNTL